MSAISATVARVAGRPHPFPADRSELTVSIVLAVYDPPLAALRTQLQAIADQTSDRWECVVIDDASTRPDVRNLLTSWVAADGRRRLIRRASNGGIAAATNDGIDAASGDVITICDHDDIIDRHAVASIIAHFAAHADHDVVYTDERLINASGTQIAEYRKPDYSPRRHLGHHYLAHLVAARRSAIGDLRVRQEYEPAQDYDFYLRVIEGTTDRGRLVGHIPEMLYSWRAIGGSSARDSAEKPDMARAVQRCAKDALERRGIAATAVTVEHHGSPTTSVRLIDSGPMVARTTTVVDLCPEMTPADVNARIAGSDDDVIVLSPDPARFGAEWATPLITEAVRPDVGAVGPMIVRADHDGRPTTIMSVGRTIAGALDDPFTGVVADDPGPWGAFFVAREVTAVAPAGLVVERSKFEAAGGLAVDVGLDLAVAELCVRLARSGADTIWNPSAVLAIDLPDDTTALLDSCFPDPGHSSLEDQLTRVEQRVPGIRSERFATTGVSETAHVALSPYQAARRLLAAGAVQLVTCDVFDTIVTRPVARPSDIFVELGRRLLADGLLSPTVTATVFANARREAERRARTAVADKARAALRAATPRPPDEEIEREGEVLAPECTLAEIWSFMPWVDDADRPASIARELELEGEALHPIPEAVEVLRAAVQAAVPVVLVSDIYLSGVQLEGLLDAAGFDLGLIDEIVTSADHRLGKAHGLLARVIDRRGVDRRAVMHIGDNPLADVEAAKCLGAHSIHVDLTAAEHHTRTPHPALRAWSRTQGSDLGISAAVRSTLVTASGHRHDPAFQYGAAVVGPALAGFSRWLSTTAHELGARHVHCMLREGATIAELMELTSPDGPDPITIHVSRWVTMRAAVIDATPDELYTALARRADLTVEHVVDAFGCDAALVRSVLGADRVPAGQLPAVCVRIAEHDELRDQVRSAAAELRARTLTYLRQRLRIDGGPIVVADVGWGGTIQEGLERILRSAGIENEVIGLYFALSAPGETRLMRGARMLSYLPNEFDDASAAELSRTVSHHADTVERIMTPQIGTLIDIDASGNPVTRPVADDRLPPSLVTAQRGLRAVVERLADPTLAVSDLTDRRWSDDMSLRAAFAHSLADTVAMPSVSLAASLGSWPHDDVAGTDHRSIAGDEDTQLLRYANARDLELDPIGRNWIAGAAAIQNPSLVAQLAAARAGVMLTDLCPDSENGMARLSAFPIGSDLAELQVGRVVAVSPSGWSVLRIDGPVGSLRSLRFDAGEYGALVEVGEFTIVTETSSGEDTEDTRHLVDLMATDLVWVDGHPLDRTHFVSRPGGHLIVPIDPAIGSRCRAVAVAVAFRTWRLDPESPLADAPLAHRLATQRRRVVNGLQRRLPR